MKLTKAQIIAIDNAKQVRDITIYEAYENVNNDEYYSYTYEQYEYDVDEAEYCYQKEYNWIVIHPEEIEKQILMK